ncbi:ral guanine nucleotide dissociation stimulator-like [Lutra lutra]|uniref:ral guanine nucleotide dissociation stimulator-like n=1 Tax=Lutra lutra TaxID=9657 RepID=UPI001FD11878|nr:ral guanine nucleotide dissociation stimulator-like [Lutra lutra]
MTLTTLLYPPHNPIYHYCPRSSVALCPSLYCALVTRPLDVHKGPAHHACPTDAAHPLGVLPRYFHPEYLPRSLHSSHYYRHMHPCHCAVPLTLPALPQLLPLCAYPVHLASACTRGPPTTPAPLLLLQSRCLRGKNSSIRNRNETSVLFSNQANTLQTEIERLAPAFLRRDLNSVYRLLSTYLAFVTTQEVLDILFARAPAPEQDPDQPQEPLRTPILAPATSLEPELVHPIPAAIARQSRRAVTLPALLGPVQVVVRALIHVSEMEDPAAPLPEVEVQQCPAPAPGVPERSESTASAEQQQPHPLSSSWCRLQPETMPSPPLSLPYL